MSWPHLGASQQKPTHSQAHQHDQMRVRQWTSHTRLSDNRWTKEKESLISSIMVDFTPCAPPNEHGRRRRRPGGARTRETLLLAGRGQGGSEHRSIDVKREYTAQVYNQAVFNSKSLANKFPVPSDTVSQAQTCFPQRVWRLRHQTF